jgi:nucleotide-binding universal stress UspA family protein
MFATIIVPLDGSAHAEAAIPYALEEARHHNAEIVLVRVVYRPEPCPTVLSRGGPAPGTFAWPTSDSELEVRRAARYLSAAIERYRLGPRARGEVLIGETVPRLLAEASRSPDPMIVLTTGDASEDSTPPLSNIARRLIVDGRVPMLAIRHPPDGSESPAQDVSLPRISNYCRGAHS